MTGSHAMASPLVSTEWLEENLHAPDLIILDASWYLPDMGRDGRAEYDQQHIPGAIYFDIDAESDGDSPLPHTMPPAQQFSARMGAIGLGNGMRVVVYDGAGLFSAARVWWMLRTFGHDSVAILDGGFGKWLTEGRPVETRAPGPREAQAFVARLAQERIKTKQDVLQAIETDSAQLADARSAPRFKAEEPEPRAGMRGGHMPGARNVHYKSLLNADGTVKPEAELRETFATAGVDLEKPVITTCGSGVTAAIITLGLTLLGHGENALYDGSWADWGSDPDTPIETG